MKDTITTMVVVFGCVIGAMLGLFMVNASGCGADEEAAACEECGEEDNAYFCNVPSSNNVICAPDDQTASGLCPEGWDKKVTCNGGTGGQQEWDPDPYITFNTLTQKYEVDQEILDQLKLDGLVLMTQDSAMLIEQSAGYFKLQEVATTDFVYHLGLRNGDIPQTANGYRLMTWDEYATAITQLDGQTSFTITVKRGSSTITLRYQVV